MCQSSALIWCMQVFLHVSRRAAMEAAEERKHAAADSDQPSVCYESLRCKPDRQRQCVAPCQILASLQGCCAAQMPQQRVLVAQGVNVQPLANGVPDDDDDEVLSEAEAEQHALLQPQPAPQPGAEPELPPVALDPAFEHSGANIRRWHCLDCHCHATKRSLAACASRMQLEKAVCFQLGQRMLGCLQACWLGRCSTGGDSGRCS